MAFVLEANVMETSTTTGSGQYTLAGALTGYYRFGDKMANNDTCWYYAESDTGFEEGIGTWGTGHLLTRTTILRSSNSNAAVSWPTGTRTLYMVRASQFMQHRGAKVQTNANRSMANAGATTAILFNTELFDTDTIHDTSSNTSRLTVPTGVVKVRVRGQVKWAADTSGTYRRLVIFKNGATFAGEANDWRPVSANSVTWVQSVDTGVLAVAAADYFELLGAHDGSGAINVLTDNGTWFEMECIG